MEPSVKHINRIFLHSFLLMGIFSSLIVFFVDIRNGFNDTIAIVADLGIFLSTLIGYFISKVLNKDPLSVLFFTSVILCCVTYELLYTAGYTLGICLMVIIVLGYVYSLLLKGAQRWSMQIITFSVLLGLFFYQNSNRDQLGISPTIDIIGIAVPYIFIYIAVAYTTAIIKDRHDDSNRKLALLNNDLYEKNAEIETQNEELSTHQDELSQINLRLEDLVEKRTLSLREKNEALARYGFKNAHNVRGPLARILGLINVSKIDESIPKEKILELIYIESQSIDVIIQEIAKDLATNTEST